VLLAQLEERRLEVLDVVPADLHLIDLCAVLDVARAIGVLDRAQCLGQVELAARGGMSSCQPRQAFRPVARGTTHAGETQAIISV